MDRGRQTSDMHHSANPDHARHDRSLIAGHAAGDLADLDTAAAADLLASCSSCSELHRDLVSISAATRALPRTARATRDFRITEDQASRLRRGSWVRTLLRPFGSARSATRPLAAAFTSMGVAGLLVATFVPGLLGGVASAPAGAAGTSGAAAGPTLAAAEAPEPAPNATGATRDLSGAGAAGAASADPGELKDAGNSGDFVAMAAGSSPQAGDGLTSSNAGSTNADLQSAAGSPIIILGSLGLLLLGLALFGLRFAARRLR